METAPVGLDALHERVQTRLCTAVYGHCNAFYEPLHQRRLMLDRVHGPARIDHERALRADLVELLDADLVDLGRMVTNGAADLRCMGPAQLAILDGARRVRLTTPMADAGRPRMTAGELVQRFAARGVLVVALDGNLHVSSADALSAADRAVLLEQKAGILTALAVVSEVI
jgi:hypothetical protein